MNLGKTLQYAGIIAITMGSSLLGMQQDPNTELEIPFETTRSLWTLQEKISALENQQIQTEQDTRVLLFYRTLSELLEKIVTTPREQISYKWYELICGKYFQAITALTELQNNKEIMIKVIPRDDFEPKKNRRFRQLDLVIESAAQECNYTAIALFDPNWQSKSTALCIGYKIVLND